MNFRSIFLKLRNWLFRKFFVAEERIVCEGLVFRILRNGYIEYEYLSVFSENAMILLESLIILFVRFDLAPIREPFSNEIVLSGCPSCPHFPPICAIEKIGDKAYSVALHVPQFDYGKRSVSWDKIIRSMGMTFILLEQEDESRFAISA